MEVPVTKVMQQIEHVVFLMLENRSLDNVLGWLYEGDQPRHVYPPASSPAFDGLVRGRYSNPAYTWTGKVERYPVVPVPSGLGADQDRVPAYDPYEELRTDGWKGVMNQLFGNQDQIRGLPTAGTSPQMQGFLQDYYARYMATWQGLDSLWAYTGPQLPWLNSLARQYAVSDRWFCSVPSQTNPNRAYSLCGTSLGRESNLNLYAIEQFDVPTIFNRLHEAGKSLGLYWTDTWQQGKSYTAYTFPQIAQTPFLNGNLAQFYAQARSGTLPAFSYIEPQWGYGKGTLFKQGTDLHPPTHVLPGDKFVGDIYTAVRTSPNWSKTLLVITFDEHGGTYDHVAPPWGAINPDGKNGPSGFRFDLFGVRVPTILVSPYVQPGTVFRAPAGSPTPFDHTSFIKTLLLWAGVDPNGAGMGRRMPAAPSFDGVLSDHLVNDAEISIKPTASAGVASVPGLDTPPPAGAGQPLDALFDGVSAVATRAIFEHSLDLAGIVAELARYRADPAAFEAALLVDPPERAPHPD